MPGWLVDCPLRTAPEGLDGPSAGDGPHGGSPDGEVSRPQLPLVCGGQAPPEDAQAGEGTVSSVSSLGAAQLVDKGAH